MIYVCMHYGHTHTMAIVWQSQDNFQELVLYVAGVTGMNHYVQFMVFFFFLNFCFYSMYIGILPSCMCESHVCVVPEEIRRDIKSPGTGVIDGY